MNTKVRNADEILGGILLAADRNGEVLFDHERREDLRHVQTVLNRVVRALNTIAASNERPGHPAYLSKAQMVRKAENALNELGVQP